MDEIKHFQISTTKPVQSVIDTIINAGAEPVLVGGAIRDAFLGLPVKDIDIEVYGISGFDELKKILSPLGNLNTVGESFQVLKLSLPEVVIDISLPRRENKSGSGHRGFEVEADPFMSFEDAASRRDFTINAMGVNAKTGELLDPYGGRQDLQDRRLRHVGPKFIEDPLRVYRAMQFAARFELMLDPDTAKVCRQMPIHELPKERILEEFKKMFLKSERPSIGLGILRQVDGVNQFPELAALIGTEQDTEWHPEGDVWVHTLMVMDEMAMLRTGNEKRDMVLMFSALCHDFGKPLTTEFKAGRIRSYGHEEAGVEPTMSFLNRLTDEKDLIEQVCVLVKEHLKPALLYNDSQKQDVSDAAFRRLAARVPIADLLLLWEADHFGRTTDDALNREFPGKLWFLDRYRALDIPEDGPKPMLQGRDLLALGVEPGPEIGMLLDHAFDAQLDGKFSDKEAAIKWLKAMYLDDHH